MAAQEARPIPRSTCFFINDADSQRAAYIPHSRQALLALAFGGQPPLYRANNQLLEIETELLVVLALELTGLGILTIIADRREAHVEDYQRRDCARRIRSRRNH
jgi:hypothetical protein